MLSLVLMGSVTSLFSFHSRVSWLTVPPRSRISVWRAISCTIAFRTNLKELRFFTSTLLPRPRPSILTETFASQRSEPSSMFPSQTPR